MTHGRGVCGPQRRVEQPFVERRLERVEPRRMEGGGAKLAVLLRERRDSNMRPSASRKVTGEVPVRAAGWNPMALPRGTHAVEARLWQRGGVATVLQQW